MPVVIYKCGKCGATRNSYEAAEHCEQSHLSAASVRELEYRHGPYPFRVILTFSDGNEREYVKVD